MKKVINKIISLLGLFSELPIFFKEIFSPNFNERESLNNIKNLKINDI